MLNPASGSSGYLASFPSPPQGVWHLGPIPIRAYALCIIAGIIVAIVWGEKRFQARGGEKGFITDLAVWAVPFAPQPKWPRLCRSSSAIPIHGRR